MSRSSFAALGLTALVLIACAESPTSLATSASRSSADYREQTTICHVKGPWKYAMITIFTSVEGQHVEHGDARPGEQIPNLAGYELDVGCRPVETQSMMAGPFTMCALDGTNALHCWGANDRAQFGFPATGPIPSPVFAGAQGFNRLSSGVAEHMCGVTSSYVAVCWGRGGFGQNGGGGAGPAGGVPPTTVVGGESFLVIGRGRISTCGVTLGSSGACWGINQRGEAGTVNRAVNTLPNGTIAYTDGANAFKTVVVGWLHACGLTQDGRVLCWGDNNYGQLGIGAADTAAHRSPVPVMSGERFVQISAGGTSTCGITNFKKAFCWGSNLTGQLGDGTTTNRAKPTLVSGDARFTMILTTLASGGGVYPAFQAGHSCALTEGGSVHCWGLNDDGQVGDGTTFTQLSPVPSAGQLTFTSISVSERSTCGRNGNSIWCWGGNTRGQLGDGSFTPSLTPVAVGGPFGAP